MSHESLRHDLAPLWLSPEAFAFNLLTAFLDTFGMVAVAGDKETGEDPWTPETIEMEIRDEFGVEVPAGNFDKLLTAIDIFTCNSFQVSLPTFMRDCVSLSGTVTAPDTMIFPDCEELAWGITEGLLISPFAEGEEFCPEIVGFIGKLLDEEGILNPPDVLRIATSDRQYVDRVNADFSDDPEMFAAVQEAERGKTDSINASIRMRMQALLHQLRMLPLQNGKPDAAGRMLAVVRR